MPKSDFVREMDYLRASDRIIELLEEDGDLMRKVAEATDIKEALFEIIDDKLENRENMKKAISARLNEKFKEETPKRRWKGQTLTQILELYKPSIDEIKREVLEQKRREIIKKELLYEQRKEYLIEKGRRIISEEQFRGDKEMQARIVLKNLEIEQSKLPPAKRIALEEAGELVEFWDKKKREKFINDLIEK